MVMNNLYSILVRTCCLEDHRKIRSEFGNQLGIDTIRFWMGTPNMQSRGDLTRRFQDSPNLPLQYHRPD